MIQWPFSIEFKGERISERKEEKKKEDKGILCSMTRGDQCVDINKEEIVEYVIIVVKVGAGMCKM